MCDPSRVSADAGWHELLLRISGDVLDSDAFSDEQLAAAEERLGVALPPSYRAFLSVSNGFGPVSFFVRRLRPIAEVAWLRDEDPALIETWSEGNSEPTDTSPLARTLAVSDEYDGARVLLNPLVSADDGEWEAWFFAHWVPGEQAHASFRALVEQTHDAFIDEVKAERGEPTPHVAPELGVDAADREGLIAALRRPQPTERAEALRGLANLRDPAALAAVIAVLNDDGEQPDLRETAARTLGQLSDAASAVTLLEVLRLPYPDGDIGAMPRSKAQEAVIGLKHAARQALLRLGAVARPPLADALSGPEPFLRAEACRTLCYDRANAGTAFDLVAPHAADPDPEVRLSLARNVGQLFDPRVPDLLRALRRDADPDVREAAADALELLEGA